MRKRIIDGISLATGDQIYDGTGRLSYILGIRESYGARYATLRNPISMNGQEFRLADDQGYPCPVNSVHVYRRELIAKVTRVEWTGHTIYGNGIGYVWLETMDGRHGRFRISDNSAIVYAIDNPEFKDAWHHFELTKANRISGRCQAY